MSDDNSSRPRARRGLGRGLEALMGGGGDADLTGGTLELALDEIDPGNNQPRAHFADQALEELAQSIEIHGVLQPILVEPVGGRYRIIAGERRYRAAQRAGLRRIPALVRSASDDERLALALIENVQREDLTPIEEANAYRRLMQIGGLTQAELAQRVGKHRSTVANSVRLLGLPLEVQNALTDGTISAGHARALLMISDPQQRAQFFPRLQQLSVRQAEAYAARIRDGAGKPETAGNGTSAAATPPPDPHLRELEQRLIDALGTKVAVTGSLQRGKIEITFFGVDDLERIQRQLLPPQ